MLKHFIRALEENRDKLDYHQYWRYAKAGRQPKLLIWLVEHPDLTDALAADARDLAKERQERHDATVEALAADARDLAKKRDAAA